jgi:Mg-chelatase subunit ChlD
VAGQASVDEGDAERDVGAKVAFDARRLETDLDRLARKAGGRRSVSKTDTRRGRYVRSRPALGRYDDIAFDATLRAAAVRQSPLDTGEPFGIELADIQRKERVRRTGNLILFMVDASWSMATAERLEAAKGAVLSLLVDAYQRRDKVALAIFRRRGTEVVLPFTNSVSRALQLMRDIAVGGKTPLSDALYTADRLFETELRRDPTALPMLVLLTDGAGNISLTGRPPFEEMHDLGLSLAQRGVRSIVIDMYSRSRFYPTSPAADLAVALRGELYTMEQLRAEGVAETVRTQLTR